HTHTNKLKYTHTHTHSHTHTSIHKAGSHHTVGSLHRFLSRSLSQTQTQITVRVWWVHTHTDKHTHAGTWTYKGFQANAHIINTLSHTKIQMKYSAHTPLKYELNISTQRQKRTKVHLGESELKIGFLGGEHYIQ